METYLQVFYISPSNNRLNRTMQYGNLEIFELFNTLTQSLNRTMQYGNMTLRKIGKKWKMCLNRTMQYGNGKCFDFFVRHIIVFKSYYVVWKLGKDWVEFYNTAGLNRTMQYGNNKQRWKTKKEYGGLNRTMQYGN